MTLTPEQAASNGWALLDERDPDWWREDLERAIDLTWLDMESPCRCVVGQLYGWITGMNLLDVSPEDEKHYGFNADPDLSSEQQLLWYCALDEAWRAEILKRRAEETS